MPLNALLWVMPSRVIAGASRRLDWIRGKPRDGARRMASASPRALRAASAVSAFCLEPFFPPVLDQGNEGSCASFMGCTLMNYLEYKQGLSKFFAEQFLYYMARVYVSGEPPDQDTGLTIETVEECLEKFGVCFDATFPYGDNPLTMLAVEPDEAAKAEALEHRALLSIWCPTSEEIDASLIQGFPVGFGMDLPSCFEDPSVTNRGEIPYDVKNGFIGGHAMTIIGFNKTMRIGNETGAKKVRNSWSESFGIMGDIWIPNRYWDEGIAASNLSIHRAMT